MECKTHQQCEIENPKTTVWNLCYF